MKKTLLQFTHGIIKPHNLDNWKSEQDKWQPLISMKIFVFLKLTDRHNLSSGKEWMKSPVLLFIMKIRTD